jgi:hypothetical protein
VQAILKKPRESRFGTDEEVHIHVDEKWFCGTHVRHVWQSSEDQAPAIPVLSKSHPLQEMFLAAVARPIPAHSFDGSIGIWPITKTKRALHKSSHHERGEEYEVSCTMTTDKFVDMVKKLIIPSALRKCGSWAHSITVQFDNAGGHGGGRGNIAATIAALSEWAEALPAVLLVFCVGRQPTISVAQPPRSPDLNVLDLGAWHSLQVAVDKMKHTKGIRTDNAEELRRLVLDTWNSWTSAATLSSLFTTLELIFGLV